MDTAHAAGDVVETSDSFNEAMAFLPWIRRRAFVPRLRSQGFNEAMAFLPWILSGSAAGYQCYVEASMRPWHFCHGYGPSIIPFIYTISMAFFREVRFTVKNDSLSSFRVSWIFHHKTASRTHSERLQVIFSSSNLSQQFGSRL